MYDRVLVITVNSYYSKVPSTSTAVLFSTIPILQYNFNKVLSTSTAVLLRSTVPTSAYQYKLNILGQPQISYNALLLNT